FSLSVRWSPRSYGSSLHDALPTSAAARVRVDRRLGVPEPHPPGAARAGRRAAAHAGDGAARVPGRLGGAARRARADPVARPGVGDRKSTRLNSSHVKITYAVF